MNKKISITVLFIISIIIMLSGIFYAYYSMVFNTKFLVLNTTIPGFIFGFIVIYLGFRYFISIGKLNKRISSPDTKFSWKNFSHSK